MNLDKFSHKIFPIKFHHYCQSMNFKLLDARKRKTSAGTFETFPMFSKEYWILFQRLEIFSSHKILKIIQQTSRAR